MSLEMLCFILDLNMKKTVSIHINSLQDAEKFYAGLVKCTEAGLASKPDLIEWRVDGGLLDLKLLEDIGVYLKMLDLPIIFTLRTYREGGGARINQEAYYAILDFAIKRLPISFIDIEAESLPAAMRHPLVIDAGEKEVSVIMSKHTYASIGPDEALELLTGLLRKGGRLAKLAFLPETASEAVQVLQACSLLSQKGFDIMAIPMGEAFQELRYDESFGFYMQFYGWHERTSAGQKLWI